MFLETVDERFRSYVSQINKYLTGSGCKCKRFINPDDCNPKCVIEYSFVLDDEQYQKCRYMAFQPTLSEENNRMQ